MLPGIQSRNTRKRSTVEAEQGALRRQAMIQYQIRILLLQWLYQLQFAPIMFSHAAGHQTHEKHMNKRQATTHACSHSHFTGFASSHTTEQQFERRTNESRFMTHMLTLYAVASRNSLISHQSSDHELSE